MILFANQEGLVIGRRRRADTGKRPTDQEVDDLIARAAKLLDELHATFGDIKEALRQGEEEAP